MCMQDSPCCRNEEMNDLCVFSNLVLILSGYLLNSQPGRFCIFVFLYLGIWQILSRCCPNLRYLSSHILSGPSAGSRQDRESSA